MSSSRRQIQFILSIAGGFGLWWFSPQFTGEAEPWDARWPFYFTSVATIVGVTTAMRIQSFWVPVIGVYLGQFLFVFFFHNDGWFLLGMMSLVAYGALPMLTGVLFGVVSGLPFAFFRDGQNDSVSEVPT